MGRGVAVRYSTAFPSGLMMTDTAESGSNKLGPPHLDIRRQLWPKRCPEDGIRQAWWHSSGRATSAEPAMPPSLKLPASYLKTCVGPAPVWDQLK